MAIASGQAVDVPVELVPTEPTDIELRGRPDGAVVRVGGKERCRLPCVVHLEPPDKAATIVVESPPDYEPQAFVVSADPGKTVRRRVSLRRRGRGGGRAGVGTRGSQAPPNSRPRGASGGIQLPDPGL